MIVKGLWCYPLCGEFNDNRTSLTEGQIVKMYFLCFQPEEFMEQAVEKW